MISGTIERRAGGWFVIPAAKGQDWSGPWNNQRAAEFARAENWGAAHAAHKEGQD